MAENVQNRVFPFIPSNRGDDLHNMEIAKQADLVLFVAGNQFMVMEELLTAFQKEYPEVKKISYETLPPGLELKQILAGGAVFQGRMVDGKPDVYASVSKKAMEQLEENGLIRADEYFLYLHNRITLMVPKENPAGLSSVLDLGRDEVRISQPNPEYEDIAFHIIDMYRDAGGEELVRKIMEKKREEGTTILTIVHHRETPLRVSKGTVDVGPVWATEIINARKNNVAISEIDPGRDLDQRERINYYICQLKEARNPENAQKFLNFIKSPEAQGIYQYHGFVPHFNIE